MQIFVTSTFYERQTDKETVCVCFFVVVVVVVFSHQNEGESELILNFAVVQSGGNQTLVAFNFSYVLIVYILLLFRIAALVSDRRL